MATDRERELRIEAEKQFPGDRRRQDAWLKAMTSTAPAAKRAPAKKTTKKIAAPARRRRRI